MHHVLFFALTMMLSASAERPKECTLKTMGQGQGGEDTVLHRMFFSNLTEGTFVEIGALDGITFSNTFYLERCQSWRGILIEASQVNFVKLLRNQNERPRSLLKYSAVCPSSKSFVKFSNDTGSLGASNSNRGGAQSDMPRGFMAWSGNDQISVPCQPMKALLRPLKHVDFWSLDVEGAELMALRTTDWTEITIDIIMIELDKHNPNKNRQVRYLMKSLGYVECRFCTVDCVNPIFVRKASKYTCGAAGEQPCVCGFNDCRDCSAK
eukprot:TRINITY_DN5335_c0_g1_i1.p1 TRINITY_DN5335_c0_g1~~TRINITY_DN5335_c0_g1_i1.p1  ORF type:complete len:273 (-),score=50.91 TRINITY_DN5335_c0_g1_i1:108-905(-)